MFPTTNKLIQCQECGEEITPEVERAYKWLYGPEKINKAVLAAAIEEEQLKYSEVTWYDVLWKLSGDSPYYLAQAAAHRIDEIRKES